jgi:hypothetical protein
MMPHGAPHSLSSSSRPMLRVIDRFSRIDAIQHSEQFPNSNQRSRAFAQLILHFRRDESLSREVFSIGNLYTKQAR